MKRKKRVSFWATERIPKRVKVSFRTTYGKRVSFTATKRIPKKVKVMFYVKKRKRR